MPANAFLAASFNVQLPLVNMPHMLALVLTAVGLAWLASAMPEAAQH